jgi:hypothetical protein
VPSLCRQKREESFVASLGNEARQRTGFDERAHAAGDVGMHGRGLNINGAAAKQKAFSASCFASFGRRDSPGHALSPDRADVTDPHHFMLRVQTVQRVEEVAGRRCKAGSIWIWI